MANVVFPQRWTVRPPAGCTIKTGHPLATGLVSVLLPGIQGNSSLVDPFFRRVVIPSRGTLSTIPTTIGDASKGTYALTGASVGTPPLLRAANAAAIIGAWTIAVGIKLQATGITNSYVYFEGTGSGGQLALIYGYSAGNYELFSTGYSGSDPRTSSQIGVSDTAVHHIGYSLKAKASAEYAKWLDGRKTVINASFTYSASDGAERILGGADSGADINAAISYLYIWDRYIDLDWIAAEPFAFFGDTERSRVYGFFSSTAGGGGASRLLIHPGMQGGMRPLMFGGCNG